MTQRPNDTPPLGPTPSPVPPPREFSISLEGQPNWDDWRNTVSVSTVLSAADPGDQSPGYIEREYEPADLRSGPALRRRVAHRVRREGEPNLPKRPAGPGRARAAGGRLRPSAPTVVPADRPGDVFPEQGQTPRAAGAVATPKPVVSTIDFIIDSSS
jgi:hypothetical protein